MSDEMSVLKIEVKDVAFAELYIEEGKMQFRGENVAEAARFFCEEVLKPIIEEQQWYPIVLVG